MSQKRIYPSGAEKRKKKRTEEEKKEQEKGTLLKYFGARAQPTPPTPDVSTIVSASTADDTAAGSSTAELLAPESEEQLTSLECEEQLPALTLTDTSVSTSAGMTGPSTSAPTAIDFASTPSTSSSYQDRSPAPPIDPAEWSAFLSDSERTDLVKRGPVPISDTFTFPKKSDGRSFHYHYTYRQLVNGEKIKRSWLIYSKKNDAVYCFCCKLFSRKSTKLSTEGQRDWVNVGALLKQHENSQDHCNNMVKWKDFATRLSKQKTIDATEMALLEAEKNRWRDVLIRLISIIQSLAERNLALRGSVDTLHKVNNGNFLKEVELMAKFDPVLKDHIRRIDSGMQHNTYLGKTIQNELIECVSDKIMEVMVAEIKDSKYYSIILDCTPDVSHHEQMSVVVRTVTLGKTPEIKEHFLGFLIAPESTGLGLSTQILNRLDELNIPFQDCRGQSYDNGANMKGKNKGVQARLLVKNPRAFYVPCSAHTLNLTVSDAAKASKDASCFFGNVEKVYNLFAGSTQRWAILRKFVDLTLKSWSETRWESRIKSIEALRYQAEKVREALLEVRNKATDPVVAVEDNSLAEEIGSFRFQICCVVWFDILSKISITSKLLQSTNMQLDVAVNLVQKNKVELISYRKTGFSDAQTSAKEICEQMNTEAVLKEKRLRSTKRHFAYEAADEPIVDAMKRLEVSFFNTVVDCSIQSLEDRFQSLSEVKENFGVLLNFRELDRKVLREKCELLGQKLSCGEEADIDGSALAVEIESLPELPQTMTTAFELLTYLSQNEMCELYPNLWVALRIACTLPVTVASAERSFSKLKLIKTYLRSSMAQERLSGLAVISINNKVGQCIKYNDVISDFASRKARKERF
ncbi:zinc finger MYM-type protein 1-like isoform X2 [Pimephales promelas]|uniref:zinc finger MYM-type protein 1-like isoform X2 n=1 Tax=Pimephales promelas TaxID=90988 RepID=UPI00195575DC|nr:zinc finger MYM-type protein 1-like isoform X2 [Pimephales promelas]KAG1973804.1 zinc finger MYM-type protein [Pimephales promelas]